MYKTVTTYGLNALKIAARNNFGVIAMPFLLNHLLDLGYGAQSDATVRFAITDRGRETLKEWFR